MSNAPSSRTAPRGRVEVAEEFCKSCSLCVNVCPKKVLRISDRINPKGYRSAEQYQDGCIACGICAMACPDAVFTVYKTMDEG